MPLHRRVVSIDLAFAYPVAYVTCNFDRAIPCPSSLHHDDDDDDHCKNGVDAILQAPVNVSPSTPSRVVPASTSIVVEVDATLDVAMPHYLVPRPQVVQRRRRTSPTLSYPFSHFSPRGFPYRCPQLCVRRTSLHVASVKGVFSAFFYGRPFDRC
ncbi:hypothetical protein BDQ17DRAFT_1373151 [Cyathus striatus]|nr:hypothetical protein BDQ17DRAFT_1373151 [Cyathus striatus]